MTSVNLFWSSVVQVYFLEGDGPSVRDYMDSENHWHFRCFTMGKVIQVTGKGLEVDKNIAAFLYNFCITEKLCSY